MKRTHLPLNGLRVLDAAARHLSFTRAADELAVTPAAVGQQIRALEDMLGVVLFRRTPKGLELTPEAEAGLDSLRSGFLLFEESVQSMQAGQSSSIYTIAVPRDFSEKWLHARLAAFAAANPDARFSLVSGDSGIDFAEANLDLAIRLTDGPGDLEGVMLGEAAFVTVGKPGEAASAKRIGWPGCPEASSNGEPDFSVSDAGQAIAAAVSGLGVAHVPFVLAEQALDNGELEMVGEKRVSRRGYWAVAPLPQWRQKKVKALIAALTQ